MGKLRAVVGILGLSVLLMGCGREYDGDQRYPLSGTAAFGGEPIDLGSISLIPMNGSEKGAARASGGVIRDGKYEIPEPKGPNAGTYRVEIHWLKKTGRELLDAETGDMYDERKEVLPPKFHKQSDLTLEIPAPENTHNLELSAG